MNDPLAPKGLSMSASTEALFQTWMTQALAHLAISPETLMQGQTALMTLSTQDNDNASQVSAHTPANRVSRFPCTTCTLSWQHGHWTVCSLSNLTRIEESHPPSTEHAFWFGQHAVGYRLQWAPMRHEEAVAALQEWEHSLHGAQARQVLVTLQIDQQEHDVMIPVEGDL